MGFSYLNIQRMWVNQPSTRQPHHNLHGQNVLAVVTNSTHYTVYFTTGPVVSQQMSRLCLSEGWKEPCPSK